MAGSPRFIIGFGERLTEPARVPTPGQEPPDPYDPETARLRLGERVANASDAADRLPDGACPNDEVVAVVTLHPSFVAKSYAPHAMLRSVGLEPVGSRPTSVLPEAVARRVGSGDDTSVFIEEGDTERPTTDLFVRTTRGNLRDWGTHLSDLSVELSTAERHLGRLESVRLPPPPERVRSVPIDGEDVALEIVLHSGESRVVRAFESYAESLDVDAAIERRIDAGGLCFIPAAGPADRVLALAQFSFLRVARLMPRLRTIVPVVRSLRGGTQAIELSDEPPLDPDLRVAVFDGGLPEGSCLEPWVDSYEFSSLGDAHPDLLDHGQDVSSALLFGSIDPDEDPDRPYAYVDHYRVLDVDSGRDPFELYDVINRIDSVMAQRSYEFISLCIGPALAIEDDEVHSWTAFLDDALADGKTLATIAAGNNGDLDRSSGNARIQVPSDCVNGLAVGAASSAGGSWNRAPYSAVGPGRSPGIVKPDLLAFGGVGREPFVTVDAKERLTDTGGTSFATPATMRTALGIRAMFGTRVSPLALKALLLHTAEPHQSAERSDVGWGRVREDLSSIVECGEGQARVLYQGELAPGKFLRAQIPMPAKAPPGMVTMSATLVFATEVDPQDPSNYTRAGVEIFFRPHEGRFARAESVNAVTKPFFSRRRFVTEAELRSDAHKWETVLNDQRRFRASSLSQPVFDIHYVAREEGHDVAPSSASKIRYAMVITIDAPRSPDLYEEVLHTYHSRLEALTPVVTVPVRVET